MFQQLKVKRRNSTPCDLQSIASSNSRASEIASQILSLVSRKLGARDRELLHALLDDRSPMSIAADLGISTPACWKRVSRLRARIRAIVIEDDAL
jgi:DNA-directed RNA polymerase specialized sigma24 family protein